MLENNTEKKEKSGTKEMQKTVLQQQERDKWRKTTTKEQQKQRWGGGGGAGWGPCADPYEVDEGLGADDFHPISRVVDRHNLDDEGLAHALNTHDVILWLHESHLGSHHYNLFQQSLPCNASFGHLLKCTHASRARGAWGVARGEGGG